MAYGQEWIRQFSIIKNSAELNKDMESFGVLYNAGSRVTVTVDGVLFRLNDGELLFLTPYVSAALSSEEHRTELLFLEFYLDERMTLLPEATVRNLYKSFDNYFTLRQKAHPHTVTLFNDLRSRSNSALLFGDVYCRAVIIQLLSDLLQYNTFQRRKGTDWNVYCADGFAQYLENNGTDIILCLRFDYHDRNGELHMVGCNEAQLIDTAGHSLPVQKPIESFSFLLPPHFRGYVYLPFTSSYRELDGTVGAPQFTPDFHEMSRIVYYFHTNEGYKRAQLHGTERVSLGAMRLVNAQRSIDGTTALTTVRSLSYAEAHDLDERYLQSHHVSTLFNRQYYYPQGMRVSFSDGLIRLHQETAGGLPFVCTNMGCDASLVPQYPPEISRVIAYIRQNPRTLHTVAELAHLACLSESRFKEKFRRVTGVSPIQFAENVRIRESCLLLATPLSVTDIAFELGYSSAAHFSAAFRRATGIPPSRYRASATPDQNP